MKSELGIVTKTIKAGERSGYDPEMDIRLGFACWAGIRYNLFTQDQSDPFAEPEPKLSVNTKDYAMLVTDQCPKEVKDAAERRLGDTYLGCIH